MRPRPQRATVQVRALNDFRPSGAKQVCLQGGVRAARSMCVQGSEKCPKQAKICFADVALYYRLRFAHSGSHIKYSKYGVRLSKIFKVWCATNAAAPIDAIWSVCEVSTV